MSCRSSRAIGSVPFLAFGVVVVTSLFIDTPLLRLSESGGCLAVSAVGGVSVDANGVIGRMDDSQRQRLRAASEFARRQAPGDLRQPSELRKVSLRELEATIARHVAAGETLPDEVLLLAGLQRIDYVFVYPEEQDVVLAGFGEGWRVDDLGNIVGLTTGEPVLLLEDLLTALRTARSASRGGLSCSIDPTQEGLARLNEFVRSLRTIGDPQATSHAIEQVLGPQRISINGLPGDSHFAYVMVAADYRMKRIGMGLEASPVRGLPSYLQLVGAGSRGMSAMAPRWWLVPDYEPLLTDGEGLTFQLRGQRVRCLTEETYINQDGTSSQAGKASPAAQKWADAMTQQYAALSKAEPVFGQLRGLMDLAIAAALITKENLAAKAGLDLGLLADSQRLPNSEPLSLTTPTQVDTQASAVKKGSNWVISASGGVQINSWQIADQQETSDQVAPRRAAAASQRGDAWWWN